MLGVLMPDYRFRAYNLTGDPLLDVCRIVGGECGLTIVKPINSEAEHSNKETRPEPGQAVGSALVQTPYVVGLDESSSGISNRLQSIRDIASASGIQMRKISLEQGWWLSDTAPAICFIGDKPVAMIRNRHGNYVYIDPTDGIEVPVTGDDAPLDREAFTFFRPFNDGEPVTLKTVMRFTLRNRVWDMFLIILVGVLCGLLGLLTPLFTQWIVDSIIPDADRNLLIQVTAVLVAMATGTALLSLLRSYAVLRIDGWGTVNLEGAIWDRLVRLPSQFFRRFSTGDLVARAMGINSIRKLLSDSTVSAIMSGIFCIPSIVLMIYYSWLLALVGMLLLLLTSGLLVIGAVIQYFYQRRIIAMESEVQNMTFQYFAGIEKLRSSFAEDYAYGIWANRYAEKSCLSYTSHRISILFGMLSQLAAPLSLLVIFGMGIYLNTQHTAGLSAGTFIAFLSAFGSVRGGILGVAGSLSSLVNIFPLWERIEPILNEIPESTMLAPPAPILTGSIDISRLTFGYSEKAVVLRDISLRIKPGEFVAVVGESGAGKSTLLRLLLGFEKPESGAIFYDGVDAANMNVRSLRQQFGVVLQNANIMEADIFNNIAGGTGCSMTEAWEAAHQAGIAADIEKMPMKMSTLVSMNGGTISGGQRQRIMIARALIRKPKILFLDEATNALDNVSQAAVTENIDKLNITRFVIAHRLSTIRRADKIVVLREGRIVQEGTFDELAGQDGLFKQLIQRQQA